MTDRERSSDNDETSPMDEKEATSRRHITGGVGSDASDSDGPPEDETGGKDDTTSGQTTPPDASASDPNATSSKPDDGGLLSRYKWTILKGAVITLAVAGVIALSGVAIGSVLVDEPADEEVEFEPFDPERTVTTGLPSEGTIDPDPDAPIPSNTGTVVIDGSLTDRSSIGPLAEAFNEVNYELTRAGGDIEESLDSAEGLIIADPGTSYSEDELDAIESFADDGGKVVILGEPNRVAITAGLVSAEITEFESELSGLSDRFDVHFDTRYVYDQQRNDGNFRHVRVEPHANASLPGGSFADVSDVVFYTPTEVRSSGDAEPVLVTGPDARLSDSDESGERTVALRNGNVLAIGDSRFIAADRYNVGDNNVFLSGVIEFIMDGEVDPGTEETPDDPETEEGEETEDESGDGESDEENDDENADGQSDE